MTNTPRFTVHWYVKDKFRVVDENSPAQVAFFEGPHAEERAQVYAQWMNSQVAEFAKQEKEAFYGTAIVSFDGDDDIDQDPGPGGRPAPIPVKPEVKVDIKPVTPPVKPNNSK